MEAWKLLCALILTSFLVCPSSSAHLEGYQADDWSASHLLEETVDQYVKPYTGALVEAITSSRIWAALGKTMNGVQGVVNYSTEYLHTYYEDHLSAPVKEIKERITARNSTVSLKDFFKRFYS